MTEEAGTPTPQGQLAGGEVVRASTILRVPIVWIFPLAIPIVMIALVTTIYIGSIINPVGHLHGLTVRIVDQDMGATTSTGHVGLGESFVQALQQSQGVTSRIDLDGVRDLLYFDAQWHAGLGHAMLVLGIELSFWMILGLAFTSWYDYRKLDRLSPEIIAYVHQAVAQRHEAK